jgi:hypothetical protein
LLAEGRAFVGYAAGLRAYLRAPLSPRECRDRIERQLDDRSDSFLRILERGIFQNPRSPYRRILEHLDVELGDVVQLVRGHGLAGALGVLHGAGAYVTIDEFKGREPIRRPGLEFVAREQHFDNPLLARYYAARTSASRGAGRRVNVDLDLLAHEAAHHAVFLEAFGLEDRPFAVWRPVPPGLAGMKNLLRHAKLGRRPEEWFSQYRPRPSLGTIKFRLFTAYSVHASRLWGTPIPAPRHVPLDDPSELVSWLSRQAAEGRPAFLDTNTTSAVRASLAALDAGIDIAGTFFRVGGEPLTEPRLAAIRGSGCRTACHYSMGEVGRIGNACADPASPDDVHLLSDKLAVIQPERRALQAAPHVKPFVLTTLLTSSPKLMLNFESGDYGALDDRSCGCTLDGLGLTTHLSGIRSYERLASGGMNFLDTDLIGLVDEVLPARFGGHPTDYQLAEREAGALPTVEIVASPRVGDLDEAQVVSAVLGFLSAAGEPQRMMADQWRQGRILRLVRREPHASGSAKVLPLHMMRP